MNITLLPYTIEDYFIIISSEYDDRKHLYLYSNYKQLKRFDFSLFYNIIFISKYEHTGIHIIYIYNNNINNKEIVYNRCYTTISARY